MSGADAPSEPTPYYRDPEFIARFEAKLDKTSGLFGCWLWKGCLTPLGYGQVSVFEPETGKRSTRGAHVVSLEIHLGERLPLGPGTRGRLQANHVLQCPNKHCANPSHVYLGTARDNTQDAFDAGVRRVGFKRGKQINRGPCPHGEKRSKCKPCLAAYMRAYVKRPKPAEGSAA